MVVRWLLPPFLLLIGLTSPPGAQQQPETLSLQDKLLVPPPIPDDTRRQLEADL